MVDHADVLARSAVDGAVPLVRPTAPFRRSRPLPAKSRSLPFAPLMRSLPRAPLSRSPPRRPLTRSLPPRALTRSAFAVPVILSAPLVPTIRFAAACSPANTTKSRKDADREEPRDESRPATHSVIPRLIHYSCLLRIETDLPVIGAGRRTRKADCSGLDAPTTALACVRAQACRVAGGGTKPGAPATGGCGDGRGCARHRRGRRPAAGAGRLALLAGPRVLDSGTRPSADPGIAPSAALGVRWELAGLLLSTAPESSALRRRPAFRWRAVPGRVDALQHHPADRAHGARRGDHRSPGGVLGRGGAQATRDTGWPARSRLRLGGGPEGLPGNARRGHPAGRACLGDPQVGAAERLEASRRLPRPLRQALLLPSEPRASVRLAGLHRGVGTPLPAHAGARGLERAEPAALLRAPAVARRATRACSVPRTEQRASAATR